MPGSQEYHQVHTVLTLTCYKDDPPSHLKFMPTLLNLARTLIDYIKTHC